MRFAKFYNSYSGNTLLIGKHRGRWFKETRKGNVYCNTTHMTPTMAYKFVKFLLSKPTVTMQDYTGLFR